MRRPGAGLEGLKRTASLHAALGCLVFASLLFYRCRARGLLAWISPDSLTGEGLRGYRSAAFSSDIFAITLILTILAALWLLSAKLPKAAAFASSLAAFASSAFMILATDFLRVYQTPFQANYIGGEQFTGISDMLLSASSEITLPSRIALGVSLAATLAILALGIGKELRLRIPAAFRCLSILSLCSACALAFSFASSAAPSPSAAEGIAAASARLGENPLRSLLFGPRRETILPPLAEARTPDAFDSDSIESPDAYRSPPLAKRGRHNVILYFFESTSWRYFDLEYRGESVLPAMRSLAKRGLLLRNHYSNYPLSANTLYSVMSSRYSMYGKSMIFHDFFDADVHTITEILHARGYATGLIHTGDLLYASRDKFLAYRDIDKLVLEKDLMARDPGGKKVGWGADERLMIDSAVEWIGGLTGPFMLMVLPVNPHHPYAVPEGYERIADPDEEGLKEGERTWRKYLNSLHYADAAMGEFVSRLEEEGLMKDTVFAMVTDHGEAFYQHKGNYNHPLFVYEENVHVPALFYGEGIIPAGEETDSVTRHIDMLPSILDLLGIEDGYRRDGESIFSPSREKMAIVHTSWSDELMAVRDGRWKYIQRVKDRFEELYDLGADPFEKANLAVENPAIVDRYRKVADGAVAYMLESAAAIVRKDGTPYQAVTIPRYTSEP
jgi:arylsulfatase A-like enzyme